MSIGSFHIYQRRQYYNSSNCSINSGVNIFISPYITAYNLPNSSSSSPSSRPYFFANTVSSPVSSPMAARGPATALDTPLPTRRDTIVSIALPDVFQKSCLKSKSYPSNYTLKSLSTYPTALKVWKNRLKENAADMFLPGGSAVDVPYRDLNAAGCKSTICYSTHRDYEQRVDL